jgi:hypothetical protein
MKAKIRRIWLMKFVLGFIRELSDMFFLNVPKNDDSNRARDFKSKLSSNAL